MAESFSQRIFRHVDKFRFCLRIISELITLWQIVGMFLLSVILTTIEAAKMVYLLALIRAMVVGKTEELGSLSLFGIDAKLPIAAVGAESVGPTFPLVFTTVTVWLGYAVLSWWHATISIRKELFIVESLRESLSRKVFALNIDQLSQFLTGTFHNLWNCLKHVGVIFRMIFQVLSAGMALTGLLILSYGVLPQGLLAVLGVWTAIYLVQMQFTKRLIRYSLESTELNRSAFASLEQYLYGMRIIKLAGLEKREMGKHLSIHNKLADFTLKTKITRQLSASLVEIVGYFVIALLVGLGSFSSAETVPMLGFVAILMRITSHVVQLSGLRVTWADTYGPLDYLQKNLNLLDDKTKDNAKIGTSDLPEVINKIEIKNLRFGYRKEVDVIKDVSFSLKKGQLTALVGITGSGKSTLLDLVAGFRFFDSGKIDLISETGQRVDMCEAMAEYRKRVGYASQEPILFNRSLVKNLKFFCPEANDEELKRALDLSQTSKILDELPNGLDTVLGERGTLISGGQRQRVALARVFLQNTDILFLDEATSALDVFTESVIFQSLIEQKNDKIIVIATHRLSAVKHFDNILLCHKGQIVEQGHHTDLLKKNGIYASLYRLQDADKVDHEKIARLLN